MSIRTRNQRAAAIAIAVATACTTTLPARADVTIESKPPSSREERVGVSSGLAIGALAGGPFGAIVGAAAGAWLGDRYHKQGADNRALQTQLASNSQERAELGTRLASAQAHGQELGRILDRRSELETQVSFRTNEAVLADGAIEQLRKFGALAGTMPQMRVRISGFADARGTAQLNEQLSKARAEAVAAVIESQGIEIGRIVVEARGESDATATDGDLDGYALERRVVIRIEPREADAVARIN